MSAIKGKIIINKDRCKGCGVCVEACPFDILALEAMVNGKGYNYAYSRYPEKCTGCANCGVVCPDSCITVFRTSNK